MVCVCVRVSVWGCERCVGVYEGVSVGVGGVCVWCVGCVRGVCRVSVGGIQAVFFGLRH